MATSFETVSSLYKNILGREGSSSETAYWVNRIDSGVESVTDVVAAFTASTEAADQVAPIINLYFTAFGRVPDTAGLQYWVGAQQSGMSLGNIAQAFIQSNEFAQRPSTDDAGFLASVYQNALGRTPDAAGLAYWGEQLANGVSRDQVLSSISRSLEGATTIGVKTQIVLTYHGLLGRSPSASEVDAIVQNQGSKSVTDLVKEAAKDLLAGNSIPVPPTQPATPIEATYTPKTGSEAGSSDASAAVALDSKYMIVADDESNVLRVYDRAGGDAVLEWDYSKDIGGEDEVDLEAMTMVGDTLYLTGSHSNTKKGADADSREIVFSVKVSGTGAQTKFDFQGKFTGFEAALVAWDQGGVDGKTAGYFGFAASSGPGIAPENTNGFSIEGMTTSPEDTELWLGFRAPQTDMTTRDKALIVPVVNYKSLLDGTETTPVFGAAIELNLGGRGIRSIDKAADGSGYLIVAGPSGGATAAVTNDFRLYTWDGSTQSTPVELNNNLDALLKATGGSFESIVSPASIKPGTQIQLLQDNGDTIWPGQSDVSKDLDPKYQQFKGNLITLGSPVNDHTAPKLVAASPADDSTGVSVNNSLTLTFDEGVVLAGTIDLQEAGGAVLQRFSATDPQVRVDYNKITLQPTTPLKPMADYTLVFDTAAVTDHAGNALNGKPISFTTGERPHYDVLITEVNSNANGGDFFEIYNYGSSTIDLSGWKMNDEEGKFSTAVALPADRTLAAGETLVIASVKPNDFAAFKSAWGLTDATNVVGIDGPGLGKEDAVVLFDANGNVVTAFNYDAAQVVASDGTVIQHALATNTFIDGQHAGAAYGGAATVSAVWDGVSTIDPHYVAAVDKQWGAYAQPGSLSSVGSPGVKIVQTGVPDLQSDILVE